MWIAYFILGLYALAAAGAIVGIIYLIIRRRRVKKVRLLKEGKTDYLYFIFLKKYLTTDR
jgi:nitrate reductase gamma subunit